MIILMVVVFLIGYAAIALEHPLKVDKAASALILCSTLWTMYMIVAPDILPNNEEFLHYVQKFGGAGKELLDLIPSYITKVQIIEHVGDVAEILFFLMGAMTIVELIDVHGGFSIITERITTKNKKKLLFILTGISFVMSAILDNLTTSIVMVMLLRKLVTNYKERWVFACVIIIAANSGGAFSPIGDVTTIMLWVKGNVTTSGLLPNLIIPSIISALVPVLLASRYLKGDITERQSGVNSSLSSSHVSAADIITKTEQKTILIMGVGSLVFVPIFKSITHLPPFIGVLFGLGLLWVYTELMYHKKKDIDEGSKARITAVLSRIDFSTILFFLGILMGVSALQCAGILHNLSIFLEENVGNIYAINIIIGFLSSIVDNVPLVAGAMGMYDVVPFSEAATSPYVQDGVFWLFLTYCAGVGGSMLIIGSAAGVVVMGLEKVNFVWYLKNITILAIAGYLCGAAFFIVQELYLWPLLF